MNRFRGFPTDRLSGLLFGGFVILASVVLATGCDSSESGSSSSGDASASAPKLSLDGRDQHLEKAVSDGKYGATCTKDAQGRIEMVLWTAGGIGTVGNPSQTISLQLHPEDGSVFLFSYKTQDPNQTQIYSAPGQDLQASADASNTFTVKGVVGTTGGEGKSSFQMELTNLRCETT